MSLFDQSSGQVYMETTSARVQSMIPTWMTQTRGKNEYPSNYKNQGRGCSSLQQMTMRACIWQADLIEPEALQWLGWHYASRIYNQLKQSDTVTFNTWSTFRKAFPEQIDRQHQFHVTESKSGYFVPIQLPSMINRLAKLDTSMLTFLCIRNFSLTLDHLLALTNITSLSALVIEQHKESQYGRSEGKYVYDWGRAVREKGAFTKLRMLVFYDSKLGKGAVLRPLSNFPALVLVGIHNYRVLLYGVGDYHEEWSTVSPEWLAENASTPDTQHPGSIWTDPHTTSADKMQQLYDLCEALLQSTSSTDTAASSVALSYLSKLQCDAHVRVEWCFRKPGVEASPFVMRLSTRPGTDEDKDHTSKKRKIRNSKQVDVGSLLGSFK